jgi:hypothetical protein
LGFDEFAKRNNHHLPNKKEYHQSKLWWQSGEFSKSAPASAVFVPAYLVVNGKIKYTLFSQ